MNRFAIATTQVVAACVRSQKHHIPTSEVPGLIQRVYSALRHPDKVAMQDEELEKTVPKKPARKRRAKKKSPAPAALTRAKFNRALDRTQRRRGR